MSKKVSLSNVLDNPLDEFATLGPKSGKIAEYIGSISATGKYGKIYVTQLKNGMFQIANGHHRVAALRALGKTTARVFITK